MTRSSFEHPAPQSGWRALRRWMVCKLGQHGTTCERWEIDEIRPGLRSHTATVWCGECGRSLKPAERACCRECGQPIPYRQIPSPDRAAGPSHA